MGAPREDKHHLSGYQRFVLWLLGVVERCVIPLLPRGQLRTRLRTRIDTAQARFHSRLHEHRDQQ